MTVVTKENINDQRCAARHWSRKTNDIPSDTSIIRHESNPTNYAQAPASEEANMNKGFFTIWVKIKNAAAWIGVVKHFKKSVVMNQILFQTVTGV